MSTPQTIRSHRPTGRSLGWKAEARQRLELLTHDADTLDQGDPAVIGIKGAICGIKTRLDASAPDDAWPEIHRSEEDVAGLARRGLLHSYALWALDHAGDPALKGHRDFKHGAAWDHVTQAVTGGLPDADAEQAKLAQDVKVVLRHAHLAIGDGHLDANDSRDRLLWVTGLATALSLLIAWAAIGLSDLPFLVGATAFAGKSAVQLTLLVALGGLTGGALSAAPAFVGTRRDEYRLRYVRAGNRLAIGLLTALLGVVLVGAGWVQGLTGDSASALFAVALAFGVAQDPLTKILEKKVGAAASERTVPTKDRAQ